METIRTKYSGNLRTEAKHVKSGEIIVTDAPVDNNGRGETFSPTDLLAASLGSCMLTVMGIAARTHEIKFDETEISITKIMVSNPRRVAEIAIDFQLPEYYTDKEKQILEKTALTCPVALSLHPDLKQTITFNYLP
jgi:putative redox protein